MHRWREHLVMLMRVQGKEVLKQVGAGALRQVGSYIVACLVLAIGPFVTLWISNGQSQPTMNRLEFVVISFGVAFAILALIASSSWVVDRLQSSKNSIRRRSTDPYCVALVGFRKVDGKLTMSSVKNVAHSEFYNEVTTVEFQNPIDPDSLVIRLSGTNHLIAPLEKTTRRVRFNAEPIEGREEIIYIFDGRELS